MLFHVTFHLDRQSPAFVERQAELVEAQNRQVAEVQKEGRLVGLWRRADWNGSIGVIDAASNEDLARYIASLPMFPFFRSIDVVPLTPYAGFEEFCEPRVKV
ncbi:muconolactone Delta-isomerase [Rhizorhabdus dicambivorans]|uniref:Muconolactone isomerase domain-containing protein n=1 Tax=Rhizorhabdus dicambivorans TaxID=1850238 RepID=A0A2A4FQJ2_9SPHN|nr:muconolactone Delta-isomerase family protein [Rhizorhabdus dicambivorans]ATE63839.1 hypothetical protein CMV14_05055 [Rhizorhabdus dicambivorans]PCE40673.1 hypothetical protein COO09_18955 [Rhizorhabdus dicambivorans]